MPRLSLVRPLLCPQSVGRFVEAARQGQDQKKRTRKVAASLLEALRLPTSASAEELTQTLEQRFPMPDCEVMIRASSRHLEFEFCWSSQGAYELGFLGELTRRIDPDWLPGVISALERWTAHAGPVLGPKALESLADYWWSLERTSEELYEDVGTVLSERQALSFARKKGLPHPHLIRDETPWRYFRVQYGPDELIERTAALQGAFTGRLSPLQRLLPMFEELRRLSDQVPEMQGQEQENCGGGELCWTVGVASNRHSHSYELANEFMQNLWQCGENPPHFALNLSSEADVPRLTTYLSVAPRIYTLTRQVMACLLECEDE